MSLCEARWFCHEWYEAEKCNNTAVRTVQGRELCWTHAVTVESGNATIDEVLDGTRGMPVQDPSDDPDVSPLQDLCACDVCTSQDPWDEDPYIGRFD